MFRTLLQNRPNTEEEGNKAMNKEQQKLFEEIASDGHIFDKKLETFGLLIQANKNQWNTKRLFYSANYRLRRSVFRILNQELPRKSMEQSLEKAIGKETLNRMKKSRYYLPYLVRLYQLFLDELSFYMERMGLREASESLG